jgi:nucleoid DNA-binding protein
MAAKKPAAKAKKAPAKKAAPKKAAATKKAPAAKSASKAVTARFGKTQLLAEIAETTELSKKQVSEVLDQLTSIIERHVSKKGPGEFVLPGIFKINTVHKPARKARKGINPFTGEETTFKAKPASTVVKIRPLKKLKEFVQ